MRHRRIYKIWIKFIYTSYNKPIPEKIKLEKKFAC